jgi:hypothetical protein
MEREKTHLDQEQEVRVLALGSLPGTLLDVVLLDVDTHLFVRGCVKVWETTTTTKTKVGCCESRKKEKGPKKSSGVPEFEVRDCKMSRYFHNQSVAT